jgi:hypothetical protein
MRVASRPVIVRGILVWIDASHGNSRPFFSAASGLDDQLNRCHAPITCSIITDFADFVSTGTKLVSLGVGRLARLYLCGDAPGHISTRNKQIAAWSMTVRAALQRGMEPDKSYATRSVYLMLCRYCYQNPGDARHHFSTLRFC